MPRPRESLLDAESLATAGKVIEREFQLTDFARLADRLARPEGTATARLALSRAAGVVAGDLEVRAEVELTCQRCFGPVATVLESASRLVFAASEDAPAPAEREVIAADPRRLDLAALVEEELLLSLPLIARHAEGEICTAPDGVIQADAGAEEEPVTMRRPFAGLRELLKH